MFLGPNLLLAGNRSMLLSRRSASVAWSLGSWAYLAIIFSACHFPHRTKSLIDLCFHPSNWCIAYKFNEVEFPIHGDIPDKVMNLFVCFVRQQTERSKPCPRVAVFEPRCGSVEPPPRICGSCVKFVDNPLPTPTSEGHFPSHHAEMGSQKKFQGNGWFLCFWKRNPFLFRVLVQPAWWLDQHLWFRCVHRTFKQRWEPHWKDISRRSYSCVHPYETWMRPMIWMISEESIRFDTIDCSMNPKQVCVSTSGSPVKTTRHPASWRSDNTSPVFYSALRAGSEWKYFACTQKLLNWSNPSTCSLNGASNISTLSQLESGEFEVSFQKCVVNWFRADMQLWEIQSAWRKLFCQENGFVGFCCDLRITIRRLRINWKGTNQCQKSKAVSAQGKRFSFGHSHTHEMNSLHSSGTWLHGSVSVSTRVPWKLPRKLFSSDNSVPLLQTYRTASPKRTKDCMRGKPSPMQNMNLEQKACAHSKPLATVTWEQLHLLWSENRDGVRHDLPIFLGQTSLLEHKGPKCFSQNKVIKAGTVKAVEHPKTVRKGKEYNHLCTMLCWESRAIDHCTYLEGAMQKLQLFSTANKRVIQPSSAVKNSRGKSLLCLRVWGNWSKNLRNIFKIGDEPNFADLSCITILKISYRKLFVGRGAGRDYLPPSHVLSPTGEKYEYVLTILHSWTLAIQYFDPLLRWQSTWRSPCLPESLAKNRQILSPLATECCE